MKSTKTKTAEPIMSTDLPDATEAMLQDLADRGTQHLRKNVESVVAFGRFLIQTKANLPPGTFGRIFKDHTEHIARPMKIKQGMAEQFMAVARNRVLADSAHWAELPSSYRTLYQLSLLPHDKLELLLAGGIVSPELTRNDAEGLVYASKKYTNFSVMVAEKVLSLARRELTASRPCQCSECGHEHYEKRSKAKPVPKDPTNNGTGTA